MVILNIFGICKTSATFMNEEELKRQLAEAGGASVWFNSSDPVATGIKMARLAQYLKNKPDAEQRAIISNIRIMGIDKALDSMHFLSNAQ